MRSAILWSIALVILFFAACKEKEDEPEKNNNNTNIEICDTLKATYNGKVSAILNANCAVAGCHTGDFPASGIRLSNYADAKFIAAKPQFLGAINHEQGYVPMPYQKDKLPQSEIDVLTCWVVNEFPEE